MAKYTEQDKLKLAESAVELTAVDASNMNMGTKDAPTWVTVVPREVAKMILTAGSAIVPTTRGRSLVVPIGFHHVEGERVFDAYRVTRDEDGTTTDDTPTACVAMLTDKVPGWRDPEVGTTYRWTLTAPTGSKSTASKSTASEDPEARRAALLAQLEELDGATTADDTTAAKPAAVKSTGRKPRKAATPRKAAASKSTASKSAAPSVDYDPASLLAELD